MNHFEPHTTELLSALGDPSTYGQAGAVERHETHASWVFLAGPWAYKAKKPVKLAFLDYSTTVLRHAACREEVRVNRELAGDIYEGVCALVRTDRGLTLGAEDDPRAVEFLVRMRRFDPDRTLQGLIDRDELQDREIDAVAQALARFHERAPIASAAEPAQVLARWERNATELEAIVDRAGWRVHLIREFAHAFLAAHVEALNERLREGRVRDCHGDLRCEHVLLDDGVRIVDRIEFDPRMRMLDVGADLAFLAMDLEANGRDRAARRLVDSYRAAGGDPGGEQLLAFHAAYWALVRAKVAVIAAGSSGGAARREESVRMRDLAERLRWRARGAVAVIVCGPAASGKSTLASELASRSGLPAFSSDEVRKELAGVAPDERARPEHYSDAFTERTYAALGERAAERLRHGEGAILDATCRTAEQRAALLRSIGPAARRVLFVHCRVDLESALMRARARMGEPERISDATPEIVERHYREFEPLAELAPERVLELDGELPLERQGNEVVLALDRRMARASGGNAAT